MLVDVSFLLVEMDAWSKARRLGVHENLLAKATVAVGLLALLWWLLFQTLSNFFIAIALNHLDFFAGALVMFEIDHISQVVGEPTEVCRELGKLSFRPRPFKMNSRPSSYLELSDHSYVEYCPLSSVTRTRENENRPSVVSKMLEQMSRHQCVTIAIRVDSVDQLEWRLTSAGFHVDGPFNYPEDPVGRESVILIPRVKSSTVPLPTFVYRPPNEHAESLVRPESTGSTKLQLRNIGVVTANLPYTVETWARLLNRRPTECWIQEDLGAYCVRISLDDHVHVMFCNPVGNGRVLDALEERGDHVFMLNITGTEHQIDTTIGGVMYRFM